VARWERRYTANLSKMPTDEFLAGGSRLVHFWTASTSTLVGYNVYRGTVSGGAYTVKLSSSPVPRTAYTDTTVEPGQQYSYVVTAVDSNGVESVSRIGRRL
jgi:fibronectin type 3 domain-containing protein